MSRLPLVHVSDSPIHGKGLFASEDISANSYVGFYEGAQTLENGMYVLWVEQEDSGLEHDGHYWMGYDGTGDLRFLNHARPPNCELDGQELYASRNIHSGEELTIDYGEWFTET